MRKSEKRYDLLHNERTNAVLIINKNHPEKHDYEVQGFTYLIFEGSKKECIEESDNWFDENLINEEERLFLIAA